MLNADDRIALTIGRLVIQNEAAAAQIAQLQEKIAQMTAATSQTANPPAPPFEQNVNS